eukprot:764058-Hanusia_phi.AAC.5
MIIISANTVTSEKNKPLSGVRPKVTLRSDSSDGSDPLHWLRPGHAGGSATVTIRSQLPSRDCGLGARCRQCDGTVLAAAKLGKASRRNRLTLGGDLPFRLPGIATVIRSVTDVSSYHCDRGHTGTEREAAGPGALHSDSGPGNVVKSSYVDNMRGTLQSSVG